MKPTNHQQEKLDELKDWVSSSRPFFLLSGSAGTGKTFITRAFCDETNMPIQLTATTHKACHVISEATGDPEVRTIHSALGLKPKRIKGEYVLKQDLKNASFRLRGKRIVVIDESSMLTHEMIKFIKEDCALHNRKYLFIGDGAQLPPIGETHSPVFDLVKTSALTEIIRQGEGSPIITLATQFRDMLEGKDVGELQVNASNEIGTVKTLNDEDFVQAVYENDFMSEGNNDKVLAWTNKQVKFYNTLINSSYGIEDVPFIKESRVVFNEPYIRDEEIIIQNGRECVVEHVETKTSMVTGLPYYSVRMEKIAGTFKVIPHEYDADYNIHFQNLRSIAIKNPSKWFDFYKAKEEYADIRPIFASSVHKAQGSTYDNVYIDCQDIQKNRDKIERIKLMYTAVTRASGNVYLRA